VAAGRETDRVFRYGGDEFALLLPGAETSAALVVAERIRGAVQAIGGDGSVWGDAGVPVSASIGVATFPRDGRSAEEILLAADRACFVAKRTGNGLIATAEEGRAIARDFAFKSPTPIDVTEPAPAREPAGGPPATLSPAALPEAAS
jgi:GGDEF domain-containing protein